MKIENIPFHTTNWDEIESTEQPGEKGVVRRKVLQYGDVRVRIVDYSPGYVADHWCSKGHFIFCIEGEMITELDDGRKMKLKKGMTYQVGDNMEAHRSSTSTGCKLFIID
jgi:quercetin dioxygenase-like cupin family protein